MTEDKKLNSVNSLDEQFGDYRVLFLQLSILISIIILIGVHFHNNFSKLLQNSGHLRYYPVETQLYLDLNPEYSDILKSKFSFSGVEKMSFGIYKNLSGVSVKMKILEYKTVPNFWLSQGKEEFFGNFQIYITKNNKEFFTVIGNKIIFFDNINGLKEYISTLNPKGYGALENPNIRHLAKKLSQNRDGSILIADPEIIPKKMLVEKVPYLNVKTLNLIGPSEFSIFANPKEIRIQGQTLITKQKFNHILRLLSILNYPKSENRKDNKVLDNTEFSVYFSNFDFVTDIFLIWNKLKQNDDYNQVINTIEKSTKVNLEEDILKKTNGNIGFTLFSEKNKMKPVLFLETKDNIQPTIFKLIDFLQIFNSNSEVKEVEIDNVKFNVIVSERLPFNVYFGNSKSNHFVVGHGDSIKKIINNNAFSNFDKNDISIKVYSKTKFLKKILKDDFSINCYNLDDFKSISLNIFVDKYINTSMTFERAK